MTPAAAPARLPLGRLLIGVLIGAACLTVALWGVNWQQVLDDLAAAQIGWMLLSVASVLAVALTKAARWRLLLYSGQQPRRPVRFRPAFEVLLIGQMLNIVVPVRLGELARIVLLHDDGGPSRGTVLSTVAIEKLIDLIITSALAALVLPLAVKAVSYQQSLLFSLGIGLAAVVALAVVGRWRAAVMRLVERLVPRLPGVLRRPVTRLADATLVALEALSDPRALWGIVAWSAAVWVFSALTLYLLLFALRIEVPFAAGLVLLAAVQLGFLPPSAPGLIGLFPAIAWGVLQAFGVARDEAVALGFLMQLVLVVPPVLLGSLYLWQRAAQWPAWRAQLGWERKAPDAGAERDQP